MWPKYQRWYIYDRINVTTLLKTRYFQCWLSVRPTSQTLAWHSANAGPACFPDTSRQHTIKVESLNVLQNVAGAAFINNNINTRAHCPVIHTISHWTTVGLMMGRRRRRFTSIEPTVVRLTYHSRRLQNHKQPNSKWFLSSFSIFVRLVDGAGIIFISYQTDRFIPSKHKTFVKHLYNVGPTSGRWPTLYRCSPTVGLIFGSDENMSQC